MSTLLLFVMCYQLGDTWIDQESPEGGRYASGY